MNAMHELPTSAYGVMRLLPDTKTGIETFSKQLIRAVEEGEVNPLQLQAMFKIMEKVSEKVVAGIKDSLLREAGKYSEKKFNAYGFEIEKAEVGTKYDYSTCGDPIYNHRLQIYEEAKKQLDERIELLKAIHEPTPLVDPESGEVATVKPPMKTSKEGLKFSIK